MFIQDLQSGSFLFYYLNVNKPEQIYNIVTILAKDSVWTEFEIGSF